MTDAVAENTSQPVENDSALGLPSEAEKPTKMSNSPNSTKKQFNMDASQYSHSKSPGKQLGKGTNMQSNFSVGSGANKKKRSPYLGNLDERDMKMIQMT